MSKVGRGNVTYLSGWGTKGPVDRPPGGGDDNGMEARVARLEVLAESTDRRLGTIEQDIRRVDAKLDGLKDSGTRAFIAILVGGAILAYGVYREAPGKPAQPQQQAPVVAPKAADPSE